MTCSAVLDKLEPFLDLAYVFHCGENLISPYCHFVSCEGSLITVQRGSTCEWMLQPEVCSSTAHCSLGKWV